MATGWEGGGGHGQNAELSQEYCIACQVRKGGNLHNRVTFISGLMQIVGIKLIADRDMVMHRNVNLQLDYDP